MSGDGDGAELDGHAAPRVDTLECRFGHLVEVDVAGRDVGGRVGDADHRRGQVLVVEPHRSEHGAVRGPVGALRDLPAAEVLGLVGARLALRRLLVAHGDTSPPNDLTTRVLVSFCCRPGSRRR